MICAAESITTSSICHLGLRETYGDLISRITSDVEAIQSFRFDLLGLIVDFSPAAWRG